MRDFSIHCEYCQSFPDAYYCLCPQNKHEDKHGRLVNRQCYYQEVYEERWNYHPCPFFYGEIRLHSDSNGNYYDRNSYAVRKILKPDGEFEKEIFVKE